MEASSLRFPEDWDGTCWECEQPNAHQHPENPWPFCDACWQRIMADAGDKQPPRHQRPRSYDRH